VDENDKKAVCYGTATVGSRGQIVIPVKARKTIGIEEGDTVLVFGDSKDLIAIVKTSNLQQVITRFTKAMGDLQDILDQSTE